MSTDPAMSTLLLGDEVRHQGEEEKSSSDSCFPYKHSSASKSVKTNKKDPFNTKGTQNKQEVTNINKKTKNGNRDHSNEEGDQHPTGNFFQVQVTNLINKTFRF